MLYITHEIAAARKISDRIAVMLDGKIIEEGSSNEVITTPKQGYTRDLLRAASALYSTGSASIERQTPNTPVDKRVL